MRILSRLWRSPGAAMSPAQLHRRRVQGRRYARRVWRYRVPPVLSLTSDPDPWRASNEPPAPPPWLQLPALPEYSPFGVEVIRAAFAGLLEGSRKIDGLTRALGSAADEASTAFARLRRDVPSVPLDGAE